MNIQWYPGHMTKTRRRMEEDIAQVDALCELVDARCVRSSRNPDIDAICAGKPRLVLLGRADLADPAVTALWKKALPDSLEVVATSPKAGSALIPALNRLMAEKLGRYAEKGQTGRGLKIMIAGIPNVGKSTLINSIIGRSAAKAEDRPGVTRGRQWFAMGQGLLLLDTPGLLWPKFDDETTGLHLAFTGAVRDEVVDVEGLAIKLAAALAELYPGAMSSRYKIDEIGSGTELVEKIARRRGFLVSGGEADFDRSARTLLDEFRAGKLGRISLERPE